MLNKLLKRCMPWMQCGKWVRIYVDWSDTTSPPVVKGPDWLNVSVVYYGNGQYDLSYNPDDYYVILEVKPTITSLNVREDDIQHVPKVIYSTNFSDMAGGTGYVDVFMQNLKITIIRG